MKRSFQHWLWPQLSAEGNNMEDLIRDWEGRQRPTERSECDSCLDKDFEIVANETKAKGNEGQEESSTCEDEESRQSESRLVMHIVLKEYFKRPKEALVHFKRDSVAFHFNGSVYAATQDMQGHVQKCLDLLFPRGTLNVKFYKFTTHCSSMRLLFEAEIAHSPHPIELDQLVEIASKANEANEAGL